MNFTDFVNILKIITPYLLTFGPAIIFIIYLLYTKRLKQVKTIVLSLVVEAENRFGAGTGGVKYSYVVGKVYPLLPLIVRLFITEKVLGEIIEECVQILKEQLTIQCDTSNSTPTA